MVYDLCINELFLHSAGQGAQWSGYHLRGSARSPISTNYYTAMTSIQSKTAATTYINIISRLHSTSDAAFRRTGSAYAGSAYEHCCRGSARFAEIGHVRGIRGAGQAAGS